jgi:Putative zinc-finger
MTQFFSDSHEYAMWDAAYVLGSLSSADRRDYEEHLGTCASCREAVSELSGMPALLGRLSPDDVAAIDETIADGADTAPPMPQMLGSLLAKVSWRRRRARVVSWTVAAVAAAVLVIGVFVAFQANPAQTPAPSPQTQAAALTMLRVKPSALSATVTLDGHSWGTHIEMNCTYGPWQQSTGESESEAGDKLAMVVKGRDGSQTQLATWVALTGVPATPGGSTSMPIDQIASVQIVSADTGDVLMQRDL